MPSTGRLPTQSRATRSFIDSNRRGTSETSRPSCSQRWARASRRWSGSEVKAKMTCSAQCDAAISARSEGEPSTGSTRWAVPLPLPFRWPFPFPFPLAGGWSSRKPTGCRPYSGCADSRWAIVAPTTPAPTISVGLPASPLMRAWRRARASPQRAPASRRTVSTQIQPISGATFEPPRYDHVPGQHGHRGDRDRPEHRRQRSQCDAHAAPVDPADVQHRGDGYREREQRQRTRRSTRRACP